MSQPFSITFDRCDGPEIPLAQFALLFVGTHWTWSLNNRCKHLSMFMDTRKRTVRVFDRDNRALTFEELAHQIQLPPRPGEEDWHHRDIAEEEKDGAEKLRLAAECHGLDTVDRVCFYEQDFYVLSNFSAFNLRWEGLVFPTSEHAYQWSKFWDVNNGQNIKEFILNAPSAHHAFKLAEEFKGERRNDWDNVKVGIMRNILRMKAKQHEYVRRKLLATGDRDLVENSWRDDFWGWGTNRDGQNMLGKLWMEVRSELRSA